MLRLYFFFADDGGVFECELMIIAQCSLNSNETVAHFKQRSVKSLGFPVKIPLHDGVWCAGSRSASCFYISVSIERPISCELPAGSYSKARSKARRCIPDPEVDKPRLDLACTTETESVCTCMRLGGVMAVFISASGPPCFPVHWAPAVVEASSASQPCDSLVIWQTF